MFIKYLKSEYPYAAPSMAENRLIFLSRGPKGPEKPQGAAAEIPPEKIEERKKKGVEFKGDIMDSVKKMAAEVYKEDAEKKSSNEMDWTQTWNEYFEAIIGLPEVQDAPYNGNAEKYFNDAIKKEKCTKVTIEKDGDREFFRFYAGGTRIEQEVVIKSRAGVPIDTAPTPDDESVRKVDEATEQAEAEKAARTEKGKSTRQRVLKGAESGKVKFKDYSEFIGTTISDIYPDAVEGDRVEIRREWNGKAVKLTAEFDGTNWSYVEKGWKKVKVKIGYTDELHFIPSGKAALDETPSAPEGQKIPGYYRVKENASWTDIARTIMNTGTAVPNGEVYSKIDTPSATPDPSSPQAILASLGWDSKNSADVEAYAKLLRDINASDKKYVWIVLPSENPRQVTESKKKAETATKKEAQKRQLNEEVVSGDEKIATRNKQWKALIENRDYEINDNLRKIVNNDDLWNYYWTEGHFKGKELILEGFRTLNVAENKVRDVLLDAIQQGSNKKIDFDDLLDAFNHKNINVYRNVNGEKASFNDFHDELYFFQIGTFIEEDKKVSESEREWYEDHKDKYLKKGIDVSNRYYDMLRIMEGAALIMDGLQNLSPRISTKLARQNLKEREKRQKKEKGEAEKTGKSRIERAPTLKSPEERLLQTFFHPGNARALEAAEEVEGTETKFEELSSEATAYRMIKLNASIDGKLDRTRLINELNNYIRYALIAYKALPDTGATGKEKEARRRRYGLFGSKLEDSSKPNFIDEAEKKYQIPVDLKITGSEQISWTRELLHDGFLASREQAQGTVERAPEVSDWINYAEILEKAKHPATREVVGHLLSVDSKSKWTKEDVEKTVKQVDTAFTSSRLFDINAAVDTNTGRFSVGISKPFELPHGFSIAIGIAIDVQSGQPIVGAMVGKSFDLSEQWKAHVQAGAGVEPFIGRFVAGVQGGFTWMSKGKPDSHWRTVVETGGGVGSSIAFNLTDIKLGPYLYAGVGQKRDLQNQYELTMTRDLQETGFSRVEAAKNTKEKAEAIRGLPKGIGTFMMEVQFNMKWTDEQLVNFYETQLKDALQKAATMTAYEGAKGISEYGVGITVDPIRLTLLIASVVALGPAATGVLALGLYGKLAVIVGKKITIHEELSQPKSAAQQNADQRIISELQARYPGVEIELTTQKLEDKDKLVSSEFTGDQMQRIIGAEQTARLDMNRFSPETIGTFAEKKAEFASNHLRLSIDPETHMYEIIPTEVESYRVYADPQMTNGSGIILKDHKILIATSANLTKIHIKRFDYFYPGEVDGAVQHSLITISDNPERTVGDIAEHSDYYVESRYHRETQTRTFNALEDNALARGKKKRQANVQTYENLQRLGRRDHQDYMARFLTSENLPQEALDEEREKRGITEQIEATDAALDTPIPLSEISLAGLELPPKQFEKKYPKEYRKLTTSTEPSVSAEIDALIRQENPTITDDQLILYKEDLFERSMSEEKGLSRERLIEKRLNWAEKTIFTPFFESKLAALPESERGSFTGAQLAKAYISAIRQHLSDSPRALIAGESIFTAVGTFKINGIRTLRGVTGLKEHGFVEGFDYSRYLTSQGEGLGAEQRMIARLLLSAHAEIPQDNAQFLRSSLAQKLFYMGKKGEVPNPLIDIIGLGYFEQLSKAYAEIAGGKTDLVSAYPQAIDAFRKVCEQVREAQMGAGTPVMVDGLECRAVLIKGYYFVINTTLQSGIYEYCKNPSTVYNEKMFIFKPANLTRYLGLQGTASSAAADVTISPTYEGSITSIGVTGIAIREFKFAPPKPGVVVPPPPEGGPGGSTEGGTGTSGGAEGETTPTPSPQGTDTGTAGEE